jgi:hypothetical protein
MLVTYDPCIYRLVENTCSNKHGIHRVYPAHVPCRQRLVEHHRGETHGGLIIGDATHIPGRQWLIESFGSTKHGFSNKKF